MFVFINDRVERLGSSIVTLDDLVQSLYKTGTIVSVTFNDIIVDRKKWKLKNLSDFDRIVIV